MYIPKHNKITDKAEAVKFIKQFSFGIIITSKENLPEATHLPFLIEQRDDSIILKSHFAKANDQWKDIERNKILVVFSEPHAYISPDNYEKELNVPTWNYISVHAYGKGKLIAEFDEVMSLLEETIENYDEGYKKQWDSLPEDYKIRMSKGIVAFEILVSELLGKKKLSQNRSDTEKDDIIRSLANSKNTSEKLIAKYMVKEGKQKTECKITDINTY